MAHAVTLSASILIQDTSVSPAVDVAKDSKTDQLTDQDEFLELTVTVPALAVDQTVDLATPGLSARSLYVVTSAPVTMKQGGSTFPQPVRSIFVATYSSGDAPASLKFSNPSATVAATVKVILASKN